MTKKTFVKTPLVFDLTLPLKKFNYTAFSFIFGLRQPNSHLVALMGVCYTLWSFNNSTDTFLMGGGGDVHLCLLLD